ncbi:hypothetical protein [Streptomyces sp. MZ04]|uniref:hypothetical protein n=1 Tax=Streptomyces sp. MZ04 TaxID=2559236 RepID=UPI00107E8DD7|nr:hypothetical protein [Streptomyces sp. MZ04]TGB08207.1 hypothetical protein E2651_19860 [Streptomyces sp. MZ04]
MSDRLERRFALKGRHDRIAAGLVSRRAWWCRLLRWGRGPQRGVAALAGAAALVFVPSAVGVAAPAVAQERGGVSATGRCGSPEIKVSYPGRHPKIYFKSPSGCSRGRHVLALGAAVWCDGRQVVKIQGGSVIGRTPIKTPTKKLPTKANCKRLQATAHIRYVQADFDDDWAWKWGNFPA